MALPRRSFPNTSSRLPPRRTSSNSGALCGTRPQSALRGRPMSNEVTSTHPTTAVVRRRIKTGSEARFEALMQEFIAFALRQPGHLDINVIRPSPGSRDYTVLDRFATEEDRRRFTASSQYNGWM